MNEIVERVALALYLDGGGRVGWWNSEPPSSKAKFEKPARAAIASMRDATEEMEKAGFAATRVVMGDFCHATDCPLGAITPGGMFRRVWRAMIDAALAGAPTARPSPGTGSTQR